MISTYRLWTRYFLWRIKLISILPADWIRRQKMMECDERLVLITKTKKLFLSSSENGPHWLRQEAAYRLQKAAENLPENLCLLLIEGYRSPNRQQTLWNHQFEIVNKTYPDLSLQEQERITRLSVAQPRGEGGGHQTGGAVDVTLCDQSGKELDMGTKVTEFSTLTPTNAKNLPPSIKKRRHYLKKAMNKAGFANYPGEWWHYSFGDRMWAAYRREKRAFYGPIKP